MSPGGMTALHSACERGNVEHVRYKSMKVFFTA